MKVHIHEIGEDGEHLAGELEAVALDLPPNELVQPVSPLNYDLTLGMSEGGIFATGTLTMQFKCICVRCLEEFEYEAEVPDFALQEEVADAATFDLTPHCREDILLTLPAHPHCDWDGSRACPAKAILEESAPESESSGGRGEWNVLDNLKVP